MKVEKAAKKLFFYNSFKIIFFPQLKFTSPPGKE